MSKKRRKKKKLSIKKLSYLLIPIVIIVIILTQYHKIINFYHSKKTGYQYRTVTVFEELNIYDKIKNYEYSETLEKIIDTKDYNSKYLKDYVKIKYNDNDEFLKEINKLLDLGYNTNDINAIYKNLSHEEIKLLISKDYVKDLGNIFTFNYFRKDNFERYVNYAIKEKLDIETALLYVNIGLDQEYYTNVINIDMPEDIGVIVNKYHALKSDYVPSDLEAINPKYNRGANNMMRHEARVNFEDMCKAALKDDVKIYSGSAYRSYNYQLTLYNRYVNNSGFKSAETFAARAGHSEHQTGLATDIMNAKLNFISGSDSEYTWLINNSYKYGFILRYPKDKEKITGYMYEEWHFRYFGKELAKKLHDSNLTYEEYLAKK